VDSVFQCIYLEHQNSVQIHVFFLLVLKQHNPCCFKVERVIHIDIVNFLVMRNQSTTSFECPLAGYMCGNESLCSLLGYNACRCVDLGRWLSCFRGKPSCLIFVEVVGRSGLCGTCTMGPTNPHSTRTIAERIC
jgi:hypothetical protein